ncbi:MAG TPA: hypothetical protein VJM09_11805 [Sphingobium sp.]|nr:hypothetical protein [Sphingobium sp.]
MTPLGLTFWILLQGAAGGTPLPSHADTDIDQLVEKQPARPDVSAPNVAAAKGNDPATVQQLPSTLEASAEHGKGEGTLIRGDDRKTLAGEVARAAEMLRQRGQQPTPEALAREIGPDALATFLNQDPSALDSYSTPKEDAGAAPLPPGSDGTVVILPPAGGS